MAARDDASDVEKGQRHSPGLDEKSDGIVLENHENDGVHGLNDQVVHDLATKGHAISADEHGHVLIHLDPKAEARLARKQDLYVMPLVMLMYLWCFIDRANIGNARLYGMERDLGMSGTDYNVVLTSFYISYVVLEYPVVMLAKIIGPGKWIPFLTFMFGLMSMCTAFVNNFAQMCAIRFLLGLFESGLLPGLAYFLSRWYRRGELTFRISWYIAMAPLAGAFGGLLAYGIVNDISNIGFMTRWRMLFFVEGLVTIAVGILAYLLLADRPATARWLTPAEKELAEVRIKADSVGLTEALESTRKAAVWSGIRNINVWTTGLLLLLNSQMVQGIGVFLPTIISSQYPQESAVRRNLLTVPCYITGLIWVVVASYGAWKTKKHIVFCLLSSPFAILGYSLFIWGGSPNAQYAGAFFVAMGSFPFGPLLFGWVSANLAPDAAKASGIALSAVFQNIGGLISSWTYLSRDAPRFIPGHAFNLSIGVFSIPLALGIFGYQRWENQQREAGRRNHRMEGKSAAEISVLGHRHPRFRYSY